MQRLILDFLARWRWRLGIFAALTIFVTACGIAVPCAQVVVVYLLIDARRGVFRVVAPLPLTRREQMRAWWLLSVIVVPLLWLLPLGVGVVLHQWTHVATTSADFPALPTYRQEHVRALYLAVSTKRAVFAAVVQAWIGFGFSAVLFLLATLLSAEPVAGFTRNLGRGIASALWVVALPGLMILVPYLPARLAELEPWHWVVFASVPVFAALSYAGSSELFRRRVLALGGLREEQALPVHRGNVGRSGQEIRGLSGVPLFLAAIPGRAAFLFAAANLLLVALELLHTLLSFVLDFQVSPIVTSLEPILVGVLPVLISALSNQRLDLRTLRTLPVPRWKLAGLLMAAPVTVGVMAGAVPVSVFLAFVLWTGVSVGEALGAFAVRALLLCACTTLTLALASRLKSGLRIVVLIFIGLAGSIANLLSYDSDISSMLYWLALGGAAVCAFSFLLIFRGLRHSRAFYQHRTVTAQGFSQAMFPQ